MAKKKDIKEDKIPIEMKVILGGVTGMFSTTLLHPLDVIKVRMQHHPRRMSSSVAYNQVARCEGWKSLYSGLSAGLLRQATYTTTRIGVFYWLYEKYLNMFSTTLLHPLDVIKVRMQHHPRRMSSSVAYNQVARCEGWKSLYSGLSAGLLRQATYTTTRIGVFYWLYEKYLKKFQKNPSLEDKVWMGMYAGLAGAIAACPAEVVLIRMMADGRRDSYNAQWQCCPRPYVGAVDGLSKLGRREGLCGYWRGGVLTIGRSVLLNAVQIISYIQIRDMLQRKNAARGYSLNVLTSLISSFVAALITLPLDVVKTRYQILEPGRSQVDVWATLMRERGVFGMWRGFTPYYTRLFFHTVITFTVLEQLFKFYNDYDPKPKNK